MHHLPQQSDRQYVLKKAAGDNNAANAITSNWLEAPDTLRQDVERRTFCTHSPTDFHGKTTLTLGEPLTFRPFAPLETLHRSQVHFFHTPGALAFS